MSRRFQSAAIETHARRRPRRVLAAARVALLAAGLLAGTHVASAQATLDVVATLGSPGPQGPQAALVQGTDGNFYGTTSQGGAFGAGAIFRLTPGGNLTELYAFTAGADGAAPTGALVQGTDGNLYGTTSQGGTANAGTVFRVTPGGALTVLYAFSGGSDGGWPAAGLIQAADGNFYGTTSQGGAANSGVVFQLTPGGGFTVLYSFTGGVDGGYPYAGVVKGANGDFYGTTSQGGDFGAGTVFELSPTGVLTTWYAFSGGADGAYPYAGLTQGTDGNFYGATSQGGAVGVGTVFQLTPAGAFTLLYTFSGGTDGAYPYGNLLQAPDGTFYGTTLFGGNANSGVVFQLTAIGAFTSLYGFTGGTDGALPVAGLILGADGNFYGTTYAGGDFGVGTVYRIKSTKAPTLTWNPPAPIAFGTPLGGAQLNATANVPGTFVYTPAAGTVLHAGPHTLTVTFTATDTSYVPVTRSVALTVSPLTPAVTWATPAAIPYGTPLTATQLNARATRVSGTFAYDPGAGTVLPVGPQTLSATFLPANAVDYLPVTVTVTLNVTIATPVITWTPVAMVPGAALTGLQLNATANTPGTFAYSPGLGTVLAAGSQTLSVTFTPDDSTDYTGATATAPVNVAAPGTSGGGNKYPLQFTPASGYRNLVVAGYRLVPDPALGYTVVGNCSYYTQHSGSGRGAKTITTYYYQTCTWDPYGKLLAVTAGAPSVPTPISVVGTQTTYAADGKGATTGSDSSLPGGFVFTPGPHYTWLTSNAYKVLPQALTTITATIKSDGNMPLRMSSVRVTAVNGAATVAGTTCSGQIAVGSTCSVTVKYDPSRFHSPTGLAYDTLDISIGADAGQVHDFVQSYTIVLTATNTHD